jgi:hypothetical protein
MTANGRQLLVNQEPIAQPHSLIPFRRAATWHKRPTPNGSYGSRRDILAKPPVAVGTGSYLPAPRTDPGVQYSRTGLFGCSRFRAKECNPSVASPCRAWSKAFPARLVWTLLPLQAANNRQPLPHVAGSPDLRVLRADPTPRAPSVGLPVWVDVTYLFPGALGASQVPDASLRTCHVLRTPPELHRLARTAASCWLPRPLPRRPPDVSPCGEELQLSGLYQTSGSTVSPTARTVLCVRFSFFVRVDPPPKLQHSIRVAG